MHIRNTYTCGGYWLCSTVLSCAKRSVQNVFKRGLILPLFVVYDTPRETWHKNNVNITSKWRCEYIYLYWIPWYWDVFTFPTVQARYGKRHCVHSFFLSCHKLLCGEDIVSLWFHIAIRTATFLWVFGESNEHIFNTIPLTNCGLDVVNVICWWLRKSRFGIPR